MSDSLLDSLRSRLREYRRIAAELRDLQAMDPVEAAAVAADLNLTLRDLERAIAESAGSERLMSRMMRTAGIDRRRMAAEQPAALREAEITCARCSAKRRCSKELAEGTAAERLDLFCPNAGFFDAFRPA